MCKMLFKTFKAHNDTWKKVKMEAVARDMTIPDLLKEIVDSVL